MKTNMKALLMAGGLLGAVGTSRVATADAMDTTGSEQHTMGDTENLRTVTVTVKSVDKAKNTVTFQAQVSPEAEIKKSGQPIKLDQLKPGDEVRASFDPATGEVMKFEVKKIEPRQKGGM